MKNKKAAAVLEAFWREKTLEQLIAEQQVKPISRLEQVWGKGSDLWTDDREFETFLTAAKGAEPGRP